MIFCLEKQIFLHRKIIFPKPFWLALRLVLLTLNVNIFPFFQRYPDENKYCGIHIVINDRNLEE